ncbi:uncharacterized protein EDB93DRAFT_603338 [Suillus bovinus]|uniref:uncharacterized protein n=1 Tax=Suillus bovinus TaxID=48563 RepID=UPI001B86EECE|nr:uncharacterized protein EDB93DRAFT_603338 [Suillus bovinus]KAG2142765.1 hypothetical protein EDB93DRAFT_603338 [Suillus bovinus]
MIDSFNILTWALTIRPYVIEVMQPSLIFKALLSFIVIAAAYPTPSGMKLSSLARRGGLGSNLVGYLDTRSPNDVSQPSMHSGPLNSDVKYSNARAPDNSRDRNPSNTPSATSSNSNFSNSANSDAEYLSVRAPGDDTSHPSDTSNSSNTANGNGDESDGDEDVKS